MKTITIRELHARTGRWVREAAQHGQILVKDTASPPPGVVIREDAPYHTFLAAAVFGSTHADEGIRLARRMLAEAGDSRELQAWGCRAEGWLLVLQGRLFKIGGQLEF